MNIENVYAETFEILSYMDKMTVMKIPVNVLSSIKNLRNKKISNIAFISFTNILLLMVSQLPILIIFILRMAFMGFKRHRKDILIRVYKIYLYQNLYFYVRFLIIQVYMTLICKWRRR